MSEQWEPWDPVVTCPQCGMIPTDTVWPIYQGRMVCRECGELFLVEARPCYRTRARRSSRRSRPA
jgi:hypothetical protein